MVSARVLWSLLITTVVVCACVSAINPNSGDKTGQHAYAPLFTGRPSTDKVIRSILTHDTAAIHDLIVFQSVPCTHRSGLGGPPKCAEGEAEGTILKVIPIAMQNVVYAPDFQPEVESLYAVFETPADYTPYGPDWPASQYGIVFVNSKFPEAMTVFLDQGMIVAVAFGMGTTPAQMIPEDAEVLYPNPAHSCLIRPAQV